MKKVITALMSLVITVTVFAQSPDKISYQAVVRGIDNVLISSQQIGMQVSILKGSMSGSIVYEETHTPTTNANGLVSLEIGSGVAKSGDFASINWTDGPFFIKNEIDPAGGADYSVTEVSQILSVPFALHAKTADSIAGGLTDSVDVTNYGFVAGAIAYEKDGNTENELQVLSIKNDTVFISNGNYVILPEDKVNDSDSDITNEQTTSLKLNGTTLEITEGGSVYTVDLITIVPKAYNDGLSDGNVKGYNDGYNVGFDTGNRDGYDVGYMNGWEDGYDYGMGAKK